MAGEGGRKIIEAEVLTEAVTSFASLAEAYLKSEKTELATDPEAVEVVRSIVATLEDFARARRARDEAHARSRLVSALRAIYERVLSGGSDGPESEAPPSRRTWHEGIWSTDAERRGAVTRVIARCLPAAAQNESLAAAADLTIEQIELYGGARTAAEAVVTTLFSATPREPARRASLRGATVFGLPLA